LSRGYPNCCALIKKENISFSHSIKKATIQSEIIFISVSTPPDPNGAADLSAVERVSSEVARAMNGYKVIVSKSTVPALTGERIIQTIKNITRGKAAFDLVSSPEFLREGRAIYDTMHPDRIVIGVESKVAEDIMRRLYKPIKSPILVTNIQTAEIIKYASNSFLSTKISFINAVANICEKIGADVEMVSEGMGHDKRIVRDFLDAGIGFGGNCFPKDLDAFIHLAAKHGYNFELLKSVRKINEEQKELFIKKIEEALWNIKGKNIGVLGLSFKPDTDDIRNSIPIEVIKILKSKGAKIKAYDPQAMKKSKSELKGVIICANPYTVARNSDCLIIMTEWEEFKKLDLKKIKENLCQPIIIDGRNIFDPSLMKKMGFVYNCMGR
jgi:UDPglucose 6-dehydrogenase